MISTVIILFAFAEIGIISVDPQGGHQRPAEKGKHNIDNKSQRQTVYLIVERHPNAKPKLPPGGFYQVNVYAPEADKKTKIHLGTGFTKCSVQMARIQFEQKNPENKFFTMEILPVVRNSRGEIVRFKQKVPEQIWQKNQAKKAPYNIRNMQFDNLREKPVGTCRLGYLKGNSYGTLEKFPFPDFCAQYEINFYQMDKRQLDFRFVCQQNESVLYHKIMYLDEKSANVYNSNVKLCPENVFYIEYHRISDDQHQSTFDTRKKSKEIMRSKSFPKYEHQQAEEEWKRSQYFYCPEPIHTEFTNYYQIDFIDGDHIRCQLLTLSVDGMKIEEWSQRELVDIGDASEEGIYAEQEEMAHFNESAACGSLKLIENDCEIKREVEREQKQFVNFPETNANPIIGVQNRGQQQQPKYLKSKSFPRRGRRSSLIPIMPLPNVMFGGIGEQQNQSPKQESPNKRKIVSSIGNLHTDEEQKHHNNQQKQQETQILETAVNKRIKNNPLTHYEPSQEERKRIREYWRTISNSLFRPILPKPNSSLVISDPAVESGLTNLPHGLGSHYQYQQQQQQEMPMPRAADRQQGQPQKRFSAAEKGKGKIGDEQTGAVVNTTNENAMEEDGGIMGNEGMEVENEGEIQEEGPAESTRVGPQQQGQMEEHPVEIGQQSAEQEATKELLEHMTSAENENYTWPTPFYTPAAAKQYQNLPIEFQNPEYITPIKPIVRKIQELKISELPKRIIGSQEQPMEDQNEPSRAAGNRPQLNIHRNKGSGSGFIEWTKTHEKQGQNISAEIHTKNAIGTSEETSPRIIRLLGTNIELAPAEREDGGNERIDDKDEEEIDKSDKSPTAEGQ